MQVFMAFRRQHHVQERGAQALRGAGVRDIGGLQPARSWAWAVLRAAQTRWIRERQGVKDVSIL